MKTYEKRVDEIKTSKYNPRMMKRVAFQALVSDVDKFGQVENLVVNKDGTLISGHMRLRALTELGHEVVTVIEVDLNETDEKLLNLTMNNPAIAGTYDEAKLGALLEELKLDDVEQYDNYHFKDLETDTARDTSTMSSAEEYEEKNQRQLTLIYTHANYEELTHKLKALHKFDPEIFPAQHQHLFLRLLDEAYDGR